MTRTRRDGRAAAAMAEGARLELAAREPRQAVELAGIITAPPNRVVRARIANLSRSGFFAICSAPVLIGTRITVTAPGLGSLPAQVRWALGSRLGALFGPGLDDVARGRIARLVDAAGDLGG